MASLPEFLKRSNYSKSIYLQANKLRNHVIRKDQVAMFHTGRCGSTVLGNLLNSHSQIFWGGEVFDYYHKNPQKRPKNNLAKKAIRWNRELETSKIYGFETEYLPYQNLCSRIVNLDLNDYVAMLQSMQFNRFIILHRKNYLRRILSLLIRKQLKRKHTTHNVTSPAKVKVELNSPKYRPDGTIIGFFRYMDFYFEQLVEILPVDSTLYLYYEDDIMHNPKIAYNKVCSFLNVNNENNDIDLTRTNPFPIDQMIDNFEEVKQTLKNTEYEWMLDN